MTIHIKRSTFRNQGIPSGEGSEWPLIFGGNQSLAGKQQQSREAYFRGIHGRTRAAGCSRAAIGAIESAEARTGRISRGKERRLAHGIGYRIVLRSTMVILFMRSKFPCDTSTVSETKKSMKNTRRSEGVAGQIWPGYSAELGAEGEKGAKRIR